MNGVKKHKVSYELVLFLLLAVFVLIVGLINPAFFSWGTMFDVVRNQTLLIIMALGLLPVVILGGFDTSFPAIASLATFIAYRTLSNLGYAGGIGGIYIATIAVGVGAGMLIALLIWRFKLPIFDLSLGTSSMINGALVLLPIFWKGGGRLTAFDGWNMKWLITVQAVVGRSGLHVSALVALVSLVGMHLFLTYTTAGRAMYALGSAKSVAVRTGFDTRKVYLIAFAILGGMAALAAVTGSGLGTGSGGFDEKYMHIYAMVIIGGASIRGGRGSAIGTLLGVLLVGIINQAFVYVRVPTVWGDAIWGLIFICYAIYQTLEQRLSR